MTMRIGPVLLALAVLVAAPSRADTVRLGEDSLAGRTITVYQGGLAFVDEWHQAQFPAGPSEVVLEPVPAGLMPETATIEADGLEVSHQRLENAFLTPRSLLQAFVGRTIRVARRDPQSGVETIETATVLSMRDGLVLQIGDRIETEVDGRLIFDSLPPGMRADPALLAAVRKVAPGPVHLSLAYLTTGLGWRADYVAVLSPDETSLSIRGYVTLDNATGVPLKVDGVRVVAGDVHRVGGPQPRAAGAFAAQTREMTAAPDAQPAGPYYLYDLPFPLSLPRSGTTQVGFFSSPAVSVSKSYVLERGLPAYQPRALSEAVRQSPRVVLRMITPTAQAGGKPMPAGVVRVYSTGGNGRLFLGEDAIPHTPAGETFEITVGAAFNITAERRQTEYVRRDNRGDHEAAYAIRLFNAGPTAVVVNVIEHFPGDWEMLAESVPHTRLSAAGAVWAVSVPAQGETILSFRVSVRP